MDWETIVLPPVSALIGWSTNVVAIRMMFRPHKPWKVPLLPITFQGLLPKRQAEIARTIGETIEKELVSINSLLQSIDMESYRDEIITAVKLHAASRIQTLLPAIIPGSIRDKLITAVTDLVEKESVLLMDNVTGRITSRLSSEVSMARIAEDRIMSLDFHELEGMVVRIAAKELRHIELLGAVIGFLIGVIQVAFLLIID